MLKFNKTIYCTKETMSRAEKLAIFWLTWIYSSILILDNMSEHKTTCKPFRWENQQSNIHILKLLLSLQALNTVKDAHSISQVAINTSIVSTYYRRVKLFTGWVTHNWNHGNKVIKYFKILEIQQDSGKLKRQNPLLKSNHHWIKVGQLYHCGLLGTSFFFFNFLIIKKRFVCPKATLE